MFVHVRPASDPVRPWVFLSGVNLNLHRSITTTKNNDTMLAGTLLDIHRHGIRCNGTSVIEDIRGLRVCGAILACLRYTHLTALCLHMEMHKLELIIVLLRHSSPICFELL